MTATLPIALATRARARAPYVQRTKKTLLFVESRAANSERKWPTARPRAVIDAPSLAWDDAPARRSSGGTPSPIPRCGRRDGASTRAIAFPTFDEEPKT